MVFPMEDVKVGSLQHYVRSEGDCEERGCSSFPVEEVGCRCSALDAAASFVLRRWLQHAEGFVSCCWTLSVDRVGGSMLCADHLAASLSPHQHAASGRH